MRRIPAVGRRTAGAAGGALAGQYPDPAIGLPPLVGIPLFDDFEKIITFAWSSTTIGGSAPTYSTVAPSAKTERGIGRIATTSTSGSGGVAVRGAAADLYGCPPVGAIWGCKIRMITGTASYRLWSGFASAAAEVDTGDSTEFIGVRSTGGNLFGVVKDGAGAGNESTVDFGVDCEGSTWRSVGFRVQGTDAAPEVQFLQFDSQSSDRSICDVLEVGSPISTNIPTAALYSVAIGLVTATISTRTAEIDWWASGGRTARG